MFTRIKTIGAIVAAAAVPLLMTAASAFAQPDIQQDLSGVYSMEHAPSTGASSFTAYKSPNDYDWSPSNPPSNVAAQPQTTRHAETTTNRTGG
jgi:hypothetical protein